MIKYNDNTDVKNELKRLIKQSGKTQKEIADIFQIKPQSLNSFFNKKALTFQDVKKVCDVLDIDIYISFVKSDHASTCHTCSSEGEKQ